MRRRYRPTVRGETTCPSFQEQFIRDSFLAQVAAARFRRNKALRSQAHLRRKAQSNERDEVAKQPADVNRNEDASRHGTSIVRSAVPAPNGIRSGPETAGRM
jgi:hypothetical protein